MRSLRRGLLISIALLSFSPVQLLAQNVSAGTAAYMMIGQRAVVQTLTNNTSQAWFTIQPRTGRSYCASATLSHMTAFQSGMTQGDPVVTVFEVDGTTVASSNDDVTTEPDASFQSRTCGIWTAGSNGFVRVTQISNAPILTMCAS